MSFFRRKTVLLPVILAVLFATPIPTRLGFWKAVGDVLPFMVGLMPCYYPNGEADWKFRFEDLYGGGNGDGDGKPSNKEKRMHRNRLWGQTALVTGANSGTGYEVSLALARLGVRVTMACRNPTRCRDARDRILADDIVVSRGENDRGLYDEPDRAAYVTTATVDTSSLSSVKRFCEEFLAGSDGDPLDMLFLNAGIAARPLAPDGTNQLSVDGIEIVFATNVVGHHLMHKLLEPALTATDPERFRPRKTPARIVLTSSAASYDMLHFGYAVPTSLEDLNGDAAVDSSHYSQSKLAQILWARELTARIDATAAAAASSPKNDDDDPNAVVYANAAHPGAVATAIWGGWLSAEREAVTTRSSALRVFVCETVIAAWRSFMWTPEEGALTLMYLGTAVEDLRLRDLRGRYFHPQSELVTKHRHVYENEEATNALQAKLWNFLDELVADFVVVVA
eukprot:CAMPEP_0197178472 /NCGR_PEP_ID=MMETSP1423-20130617/3740_1 /TAXON_ID=476441 /ORGANISM="Pseudo-nitzschia heimii, Strain UNC1101" /LENGTH=451 /DNA_ID=CAMNT_0042628219 /DNA_START=109 /DNA_END=1464 /DNA_ORIENTATION=+